MKTRIIGITFALLATLSVGCAPTEAQDGVITECAPGPDGGFVAIPNPLDGGTSCAPELGQRAVCQPGYPSDGGRVLAVCCSGRTDQAIAACVASGLARLPRADGGRVGD
ncbi:hypothetical protein KBD34_04110 [Patescibacteria group bacterium]|nr:hypothetical protein [Patescibacteria group bacterium]